VADIFDDEVLGMSEFALLLENVEQAGSPLASRPITGHVAVC